MKSGRNRPFEIVDIVCRLPISSPVKLYRRQGNNEKCSRFSGQFGKGDDRTQNITILENSGIRTVPDTSITFCAQ